MQKLICRLKIIFLFGCKILIFFIFCARINKKMKGDFKLKKTLAFILAVTLANFNIYSVSAKEVETIDIIHTTDIHGNAEAADGYLGYGKIAGYINSVREENENTLVLDSGDTYEGSNYSNISKGESVVPILKTIGYDAMTLGNHEFAYNSQIRNALIASAGIPVVSANITTITETCFMTNTS